MNEANLRELGAVIDGLITTYEGLLDSANTRREAMHSADTGALSRCMERDAGLVQEIAQLETRRERVVAQLANDLGSDKGAHTTLTWIARRAPEPWRESLVERADKLRVLIHESRKAGEQTRLAAEILSTHMQGLMKQVHAKLNHAKTYGRLGSVETGRSVVSALDLTT